MSKSSTLSNIENFVFSVLVASSLFGSGSVVAEEELIGSNEFRISCASCHGVGGRGNGNMAQFLTIKPADLTVLAKNNGGEYPFMKVFQMIDGRSDVSGHGDRAMPVWGSRYKKEDAERYGSYGGEAVVRARVLELVYYIQLIQQKQK